MCRSIGWAIRPILLVMLSVCLALTTYAQSDLEENLVGYWHFDGSLAEVIGGHHGFPLDDRHLPGVAEKYFASPFRQGVEMDGSYFINVPNSEGAFDHLRNSVSFWIKPAALNVSVLFAGSDSWYVDLDAEGILRGYGNMDSAFADPTILTVDHEQWYHVVVTANGFNRQTVYVNGRRSGLQGEGGSVVDGRTHALAIGGRPDWRNRFFQGTIDELAIWTDRVLIPKEVRLLWNDGKGRTMTSLLADEDNDGLPSVWERRVGLSPFIADTEEDGDRDGISLLDEYRLGTSPLSSDTDGDGLSDLLENRTGVWDQPNGSGTRPLFADSDGDGLDDGRENPNGVANTFATDPNVWDSDGDGFSDGDEAERGTDPLDKGDKPDLRERLQAYWPFDHGLREMIAEREATFGPSGRMRIVKTRFGNGLDLNGGQFVDIDPEPSDLGFLGESFSISCWITPTIINFDRIVAATSTIMDQGAGRRWHLGLVNAWYPTNRGVQFAVPRGQWLNESRRSTFEKTGNFHFELGHPYHLAGVYFSVPGGYDADLNKPLIYVNGIPVPMGPRQALVGHGGDPAHRALRLGHRLTPGDTYLLGLNGVLDDVAIWDRPLTVSEIRSLYRSGLAGRDLRILIDSDEDEDGLPDSWEEENGLDPSVDDRLDDLDGDGIDNTTEYLRRTRADLQDTDGDGLSDLAETSNGEWFDESDTGTHPLIVDTDGDQLSDGMENPRLITSTDSQSSSDPNEIDSDGDGHLDAAEFRFGEMHDDAIAHLSKGLAAYWPLDGDSSERVGEYEWEAVGDVRFVSGRFGNALSLSGQGEHLTVPTFEDSAFVNQNFTVSLWFWLDDRHPSHAPSDRQNHFRPTLIAKGWESSWRLDWHFSAILDRPMFTAGRGNSDRTLARSPFDAVSSERWHHALITVDVVRQFMDFRINGITVENSGKRTYGAYRPGVEPSAFPLSIGSNPEFRLFSARHESGASWAGMIDDVAIWKRALTRKETGLVAHSGHSVTELLKGRDHVFRDSDSDGITDLNERKAGTDPHDPTSVFKILWLNAHESRIEIVWSGVGGKSYIVEFSPGLRSPWKTVGEVTLEDHVRQGSFVARNLTGRLKGFYRVRTDS